MAIKGYKEVDFDQKISDQVDLEDFVPEENTLVKEIDQFGYTKEKLYNRNIKELSVAVQGVQEFYVATASGGAVTTKLTFTDGVLTLVT